MLSYFTILLCAAWVSQVSTQTSPGFTPAAWRTFSVAYGNIPVNEGNSIPLQDVTEPPTIKTTGLDTNQTYQVFLIDPDAASGTVATHILHWYQPNLRAVSGGTLQPTTSTDSVSYVAPAPPPGPGHNYTFVLYKQPYNWQFPQCYDAILQANTNVSVRFGFNLVEYQQAAKIGQPYAGNYFVGQNTSTPTTTLMPTTTSYSTAPCTPTS